MKTLRSLLLPAALSAAIIVPVAVFAQQANQAPAPGGQTQSQWQGHGHRHGHGFMRFMRGVNLSDQQKAQMKQLMQQYRQSHPAGSQPDPAARQQLRAQMLNILTPEQRAQVQQNIQQMRQRRMERSQEQPNPAASPAF